MRCRVTPVIIAVCAGVFVLLWIYGLHSHYKNAFGGNGYQEVFDEPEEVYNFENIVMEPIRGRKNIIFLETSCAIKPNQVPDTGLFLSKRQACSVESAAKAHPSSTVHLLYTCSLNGGIEKSLVYIKQLFKYPNVKIWKIDIPEFLKGTPLQDWDFQGHLVKSYWPVFHSSDVLRFVSLYKYGGIYLDLDVVIKRSLEDLGPNFAAAESNSLLSACALSMSAEGIGQEVAKLCLENTFKDFNGDLWNHNGPDLISKVLKEVCGADQVEKMNAQSCRGFNVLSKDVFTAVEYSQWAILFRSTDVQEVMNKVDQSHGVHMWNYLSTDSNVNLLVQQPYGLLALNHCPHVHRRSDINF